MKPRSEWVQVDTFAVRARQLERQAEAVMRDLQAQGKDWQAAWKTHPIAIAYRQLLKDAWATPVGKKP